MSLYRRFPGNNLPSFITTNTSERRRIFTDAPTCDLLIRIIYEVRSETQIGCLPLQSCLTICTPSFPHQNPGSVRLFSSLRGGLRAPTIKR